MRFGLITMLGVSLLGAGCVQAPPPLAPPAPGNQAASAAAKSEVAIATDIANLRRALRQEVPQHTRLTKAGDRVWIFYAKSEIAEKGYRIDRPQLLVVVDRNPKVQQLAIVLARPHAPWQVIGGSKVSTGQAGRRGYFITPTGIFLHTAAIRDYRALGTFNENHIRGLGLKGMRVWDFGWHSARKGWLRKPERGDIRLLLHATDPDYLEQRLGHPASQGCVRISAAMNRFLDEYGVLDADYEHAARDDDRFRALLLRDRNPTRLAGDALVVIDSSDQARTTGTANAPGEPGHG